MAGLIIKDVQCNTCQCLSYSKTKTDAEDFCFGMIVTALTDPTKLRSTGYIGLHTNMIL